MSINELQEFSKFIEEISHYDDVLWNKPIKSEKWSINEIISHIWLWDKYSLDLMLPIMREGVTLRFIDHTAINTNAESFARTLDIKDELIFVFKETRNDLINECFQLLSRNVHFYVGKNEYNIETYVNKFITNHDKHHMKQIEEFIKNH